MPRPTSNPSPTTRNKPAKKSLPPGQTSPSVIGDAPVIATHQTTPESDTEPAPNPPQYDVPNMDEVFEAFPQIKGIRRECAVPRLINKQDFSQLVSSIKKIGMMNPILVNDDDELLDGRGRLAAAFVLEIEPKIEKTDEDPIDIAFINLARRHDSKSQKSVLAGDLLAIEREAATERRLANLIKGNKIAERDNCRTQETETGRASDIAGRKLGVSGKSVERAAKLSPDLKDKVRNGELTLNAAVNQDKKRKAASSTPDETVTAAEAPDNRDLSVTILYDSEPVSIYGNSHTPVQVGVYLLDTGEWRVIRPGSAESSDHESKPKAFMKAVSMISRLVNRADD